MGLSTKVSVVIPVYNSKETIVDCLESVFSDNNLDVECIVVDDGSTDGSGAIVSNYIADHKDFLIRLMHQPNKGVSAARNYGLDAASYPYVTFLDSDDCFDIGWQKNVKDALSNFDNEILIFSSSVGRSDWVNSDTCVCKCLNARNCDIDITPTALCGPVSKVYSARFLNRNNIRFDSEVKVGEDVLFNVEAFLNCSEVAVISRSIYLYRKNLDSVTNKPLTDPVGNELAFHIHLKRLLLNSHLSPTTTKRLIYKNCLGGLLGLIANQNSSEPDIEMLLKNKRDQDYQMALESLFDFYGDFSLAHFFALFFLKAGSFNSSKFILTLYRLLKFMVYRTRHGIIIERI